MCFSTRCPEQQALIKKNRNERGRVLIFPVAVEAHPIGLAGRNQFQCGRVCKKGYGRMKRGREWIHPWIRRYILPSARFIKEWKQCFRSVRVCARDGRSNVDRKGGRRDEKHRFFLLDIYICLSFSLYLSSQGGNRWWTGYMDWSAIRTGDKFDEEDLAP